MKEKIKMLPKPVKIGAMVVVAAGLFYLGYRIYKAKK